MLTLGDEAARELHSETAGQFLLTEILMLETCGPADPEAAPASFIQPVAQAVSGLARGAAAADPLGLDPAGAVAQPAAAHRSRGQCAS